MKQRSILCAVIVLCAALPARGGGGEETGPPDPAAAQKKEAAPPAQPPDAALGDPLGRVRSFVRAFNLHDAEAMARHLAEDVQWLNIEGPEISVEASGVDEVRKAMSDYFKAAPAARVVMEDPMVSGRYVIFRERAYWETTGTQTRSFLAVYELEGGTIRRVWYFPAER